MTATAEKTESAGTSPARRFKGLWPQWLLYHRRPRLWQELLLTGVGYFLYSKVRNLIPQQESIAQRHGRSVQWLQDHLRLNFELSVNRYVFHHEWIAQTMDYYYATMHFVVTIGVLVWLFVARKRVYRGMRTALYATTLFGLAGFYLYPLAPPRLLEPIDRYGYFRHAEAVPHVGFAGRSRRREAHQPVRGDAQPAHRLVDVVRDRGVLLHPAGLAAGAGGLLPDRHLHGHRGDGQPLHHRRGRRPDRRERRLRRAVADVRASGPRTGAGSTAGGRAAQLGAPPVLAALALGACPAIPDLTVLDQEGSGRRQS